MTEGKRTDDYDFQQCLDCAIRDSAIKEPIEVVDILAAIFGENDGPSWHYILKLKKGYAYLTGWCDYTGWGCQDGGAIAYETTARKAAMRAPEEDYGVKLREQLLAQLKGKQPYGLQIG